MWRTSATWSRSGQSLVPSFSSPETLPDRNMIESMLVSMCPKGQHNNHWHTWLGSTASLWCGPQGNFQSNHFPRGGAGNTKLLPVCTCGWFFYLTFLMGMVPPLTTSFGLERPLPIIISFGALVLINHWLATGLYGNMGSNTALIWDEHNNYNYH